MKAASPLPDVFRVGARRSGGEERTIVVTILGLHRPLRQVKANPAHGSPLSV
ncbi:hypothetical protein ASZ90_015844 [hydrocarbon metagenome]|uniref:Uncharacterized protein n=1 Tax=hydrocarbon metagenome TaxID=938273 RepID=A0A0W8F0T9_9ZZZZ